MADLQSSPEEFSIKGAARRASAAQSTDGHSEPSSPSAPAMADSSRRSSMSKSEGSEDGETREDSNNASAPPLPDEPTPGSDSVAEPSNPPLPDEPLPADSQAAAAAAAAVDDGWETRYDYTYTAWYFFNRFTNVSQWENPRVPEASQQTVPFTTAGAPGTESSAALTSYGAPGTEPSAIAPVPSEAPPEPYLGYNPKIHGDYETWLKQNPQNVPEESHTVDMDDAANMIGSYDQLAAFNRRTGAFQGGAKNAEYHNDDNKSRRQMNAFFDVEHAANLHGGVSLKAERAKQKVTKKQAAAYNQQRKDKKLKKRMEFLRS